MLQTCIFYGNNSFDRIHGSRRICQNLAYIRLCKPTGNALSLLAIAVWLKKAGRNYNMLTIPMIFMLVVTLSALVLLIKSNLAAGNYLLVVFPVLLFILAVVLAKEGYSIIFGSKKLEEISKSH